MVFFKKQGIFISQSVTFNYAVEYKVHLPPPMVFNLSQLCHAIVSVFVRPLVVITLNILGPKRQQIDRHNSAYLLCFGNSFRTVVWVLTGKGVWKQLDVMRIIDLNNLNREGYLSQDFKLPRTRQNSIAWTRSLISGERMS